MLVCVHFEREKYHNNNKDNKSNNKAYNYQLRQASQKTGLEYMMKLGQLSTLLSWMISNIISLIRTVTTFGDDIP